VVVCCLVRKESTASQGSSPDTEAGSAAEKSQGNQRSQRRSRRFEFSEGTSNKFWEISLDGANVTTRWGKIGTDGQEKTKGFASEEKARKEYDKLVEEKTGKGYVERGLS